MTVFKFDWPSGGMFVDWLFVFAVLQNYGSPFPSHKKKTTHIFVNHNHDIKSTNYVILSHNYEIKGALMRY